MGAAGYGGSGVEMRLISDVMTGVLAYHIEKLHMVLIGIGVVVVVSLLVVGRIALTRRHARRGPRWH